MTSLLDTRYMTLSGSLESLFSRVDTLEAFTPSQTQEVIFTGVTLSSEQEQILANMLGSVDSMIMKVATTFNEMATFTKSVVF